jgi:hypothetical protein
VFARNFAMLRSCKELLFSSPVLCRIVELREVLWLYGRSFNGTNKARKTQTPSMSAMAWLHQLQAFIILFAKWADGYLDAPASFTQEVGGIELGHL